MPSKTGWSRRNFVQLMGTAALASRASGLGLLPKSASAHSLNDGTILFVGRTGKDSSSIEVLAAKDGKLHTIQSVESERAVSMAVSSDHRSLYVVNEISQYEGLPRGTVEAYSIAIDGQLALLSRQPLSLSATMPKHLALSPTGKSILVTAQEGAVINTLPVLADGSLGRPDGIYKFTGHNDGRTAQPSMTAFDVKQRLISLDAGTGSLRVLRQEDNAMVLHAHAMLDSEVSPHQMALHHEAGAIYLASAQGIDRYSYAAESGRLLSSRQRVGQNVRSITIHPSGRLLVASHKDHGLSTWSIAADGELRSIGLFGNEAGRLDTIEITPDGGSLLAINSANGTIVAAKIDQRSGSIDSMQTVAKLESPQSLAAIYA